MITPKYSQIALAWTWLSDCLLNFSPIECWSTSILEQSKTELPYNLISPLTACPISVNGHLIFPVVWDKNLWVILPCTFSYTANLNNFIIEIYILRIWLFVTTFPSLKHHHLWPVMTLADNLSHLFVSAVTLLQQIFNWCAVRTFKIRNIWLFRQGHWPLFP